MGFQRGLAVDSATGWNMDDEEQMEEVKQRVRDEEPALLILSPVCRAFSTLIELTQTTGKLSEVKHWNFMERCVKHLKFCFRMYGTQRNARILYLHEHPWNAWSRDFSFFNEMAEKDGVHKTECDLFRFQLATNRIEKESWFMSNSECIMEGLSMRCYIRDGQAKNHMKKFVYTLFKEREIDSVKAIGSTEVGVTCEKPNVQEI